MNTYISLLRGINVSGQKKIKMEDLRKLYESLGYEKVKSYIQSGNVLFQSAESADQSAKKIITAIKKQFGFDVSMINITPAQIKKTMDQNPYPNPENPSRLFVMFLWDKVKNPPLDEINAAKQPSEEFKIKGDRVYLNFPDGVGRSKLSNNFFEKKLGITGTMRNWRSVNKLYDLSQEL